MTSIHCGSQQNGRCICSRISASKMDNTHEKDIFKDIKNDTVFPLYSCFQNSDNMIFSEGIFRKKDFSICDLKRPENTSYSIERAVVCDPDTKLIKVRLYKTNQCIQNPIILSTTNVKSNFYRECMQSHSLTQYVTWIIYILTCLIIFIFCRRFKKQLLSHGRC